MRTPASMMPLKPLTFRDVPLALEAEAVKDLKIVQPNGIEYFLKCTAPSPRREPPGAFSYRPCTSFLSKVYFDESQSPFRDVCIFFNGLDETPHSLNSHELFGFYNALGKTLAGHGMLAILLPSPFHLNRSLVYKSRKAAEGLQHAKGAKFLDLTRPSNAMMIAPYNLYINHYQSFRELVSLCRGLVPERFSRRVGSQLERVCATRHLVPAEASSFLHDKIAPSARLSLIGYSMGALRAMTAFCFAWEMAVRYDEEPLFNSCVAINAGGSFSDMRAPSWVDRPSWRAMVRALNLESFDTKLQTQFTEEQAVFESYRKVIRDVTIGNALKFKELENLDAEFTRRLLFILGGSDDIMRLSSLQRLTPPGGLNIFHVAGVGHMFRHGEWGTQLGGMLDHVSNFIDASSKDAGKLSSREIVEFLSLVDWRFPILHFQSQNMLAKSDKDSDISSAIARLENFTNAEKVSLVALILRPISEPVDKAEGEIEVIVKRYGEQRTQQLAAKAVEFVRNRLLFELRTRIEAGECHPGLYRQIRRSFLLGWIIAEKKELVEHWECFTSGEYAGTRLGDVLVDRNVVPRSLVDSSLQKQCSLLETVRAKMSRAFSVASKEEDLSWKR